MKKNKRIIQIIVVIVIMAITLMDTSTAKEGAAEGIQLCIQSVIPSLFPFIFLSLILTSRLFGMPLAILSVFSKTGMVPKGCESILLMAFLGGYPVGAQTVYCAWAEGSLENRQAKRLLGFCNNAGPSFIFGIMSSMFQSKAAIWLLWVIHIASALIVGWILPYKKVSAHKITLPASLSATEALKKATSSMAGICGWIIIIRTFLSFASKHFLKYLPPVICAVISGCIELTNGCMLLPFIADEALRFIAASFLLAIGGLCVYLQTRSVTGMLGTGMYLIGKLIQSIISLIFSYLLIPLLYPDYFSIKYLLYFLCGLLLLGLIMIPVKKSCSNLKNTVV